MKENKKKSIYILLTYNIILIIYYIYYSQSYEYSSSILYNLAILLILLDFYIFILLVEKNLKFFYQILLVIVAIDLCSNAFISVHDRSLISQNSKQYMDYFDATEKALLYIKSIDENFYRINKKYAEIDLNDSMFQNYYGEKLYSSILSKEIWDMMDLFNLRVKNSNYLYGFDDKQILRNLTVGKYRLSKIPNEYYGYELINTIDGINIYINKNVFDFGVLYNQYISDDVLQNMNSWEIQSMLLNACIIDVDIHATENLSLILQNPKLNIIDKCLISENKNISGNIQTILLENKNKKPLILEIDGENVNGTINILTEECGETPADIMTFSVMSGTQCFYIDNLNIDKLSINSISGIVNGLKLYEIDSNSLETAISCLNNNSMKLTSFSDTYITGTVDCNEEKILFIPIPYNKNWNVYINNEKAKVYQANAGFMGVFIPIGNSNIEIEYESVSFNVGCIISVLSVFLVLFVILYTKFKRRDNIYEK